MVRLDSNKSKKVFGFSIIIEASQSGIYEITNVLDQFDCIGNYSGSAEIIINPCSLSVYDG